MRAGRYQRGAKGMEPAAGRAVVVLDLQDSSQWSRDEAGSRGATRHDGRCALSSSKLARSFRRPWSPRRICEVVEVAVMLGDSMVGVKRCVDPRRGRVSRATWAIASCGLACLLASAITFGFSVRAAASDATRLAHHTRVLKRPAYAFRPHQMSELAGGVVLGGLALGLAALVVTLLRAGRDRDRDRPSYWIGTARGVDQPLEGAPAERFPLVAPSGDGFVFHLGPGVEGELIAGGVSTPLSQLVAAGHARPSATVPGAFEIPIPTKAEILARVGRVTFLVSSSPSPSLSPSSVDRTEPRLPPAPVPASDLRAMWYLAGSLAVHLAILHVGSRAALAEDAVPPVICIFSPFDPCTAPLELEEEHARESPCISEPVAGPRSREEEIERALAVARTAGIFVSARPFEAPSTFASTDLDPSGGLDDPRTRWWPSIASPRDPPAVGRQQPIPCGHARPPGIALRSPPCASPRSLASPASPASPR